MKQDGPKRLGMTGTPVPQSKRLACQEVRRPNARGGRGKYGCADTSPFFEAFPEHMAIFQDHSHKGRRIKVLRSYNQLLNALKSRRQPGK